MCKTTFDNIDILLDSFLGFLTSVLFTTTIFSHFPVKQVHHKGNTLIFVRGSSRRMFFIELHGEKCSKYFTQRRIKLINNPAAMLNPFKYLRSGRRGAFAGTGVFCILIRSPDKVDARCRRDLTGVRNSRTLHSADGFLTLRHHPNWIAAYFSLQ